MSAPTEDARDANRPSGAGEPGPRVDRRRFFRAGLRRLLDGVAESVEGVQQALARSAAAHAPAPPTGGRADAAVGSAAFAALADMVLRPPGALPEAQFRSTCTACGDCVRVCPANCIRIDPGQSRGHGKAYIDADTAACVVCESLACMHHCPPGALLPVPLVQIRMGTAVWRDATCIRSTGEECRICVEKCPIGSSAIDIAGREVVINPLHCVGCGMCQHFCPTSPKSVVVIPAAAKQPVGSR